MNRYLTTGEASRVLGVTPATVKLMAERGDLTVSATTERGIRLFDPEEVVRLAKVRREGRGHGVAR